MDSDLTTLILPEDYTFNMTTRSNSAEDDFGGVSGGTRTKASGGKHGLHRPKNQTRSSKVKKEPSKRNMKET